MAVFKQVFGVVVHDVVTANEISSALFDELPELWMEASWNIAPSWRKAPISCTVWSLVPVSASMKRYLDVSSSLRTSSLLVLAVSPTCFPFPNMKLKIDMGLTML